MRKATSRDCSSPSIQALIPDGAAVLAWFGTAGQDTVFPVNPDGLATADGFGGPDRVMTQGPQAIDHVGGNGTFDLNIHGSGDWEDTRRILRFLNVHAEIEILRQKLHVTERLVLATHDAERHDSFVAVSNHAGDDGVQRTLVRGNAVQMPFFKGEALRPVRQHNAGFRGHLDGAEIGK